MVKAIAKLTFGIFEEKENNKLLKYTENLSKYRI